MDSGQAADRDDREFLEALDAYAPLVLDVIRPFATDPRQAKGLFQAVWTRVYEERRTCSDPDSFAVWLRGFALSVCLDHATHGA